MKTVKNGLVFCPDGVFRALDVTLENGTVTALGECLHGGDTIDAANCLVTPGLIDIHTHGAMGADASDGDASGLRAIARHQAAHGITGFLATTMSLGEDTLTRALRTAAAAAHDRGQDEAHLLGINLEGPFFDLDKRGAQNADFIIPPDLAMFRRLWDAADGMIRIADIAPELPGATAFIRAAAALCRVSLAHTAADYDHAIAGFDAGATHVTHLFNAMPPLHHRDPGVIGAAADRAEFVEVISDGVHLHPAVVRAAFRLFGAERVCLISDSVRACGMPPGTYTLGGQDITVTDDRAVLPDGTLAGSITPLSACLRRAVSFGIPLEQALIAATKNPAKAAGVLGTYGTIEPGKAADLVLWTQDMQVEQVLIDGRLLG